MKKIYLFACATLLAFSSCTNEISEDGFVDKTNAISFNAYPTKSRALVAGDVTTDNMKLGNFGVVGYTNSNKKIYLYTLDNSTPENPVYKAVEQTWVSKGENDGSWEYKSLGDLKFWPNDKMDFYAYFPHSDKATFATENSTGTIITIPNVDCSHDVLFTFAKEQPKLTRVPLTFHHAFAKIKSLKISMPDDGTLYKSHCQVEVQKVEFINTSTSGTINVDKDGVASYTVDESNVTLKEDLSPVKTINRTNNPYLISNGTNAKGYLFATNNTNAVNFVKGTAKTMWDGVKSSINSDDQKLSTSQLVCLKLTCKVWNGTSHYYVGSASTYGDIYIPLTGDKANPNSIATFNAGKRYIYNIVMKDNVGFTDEGDPILTPILFKVTSVDNWADVTVTITL